MPWLRDAVLDWAVILGALGVVHVFSNPVTWLLALLIIGNRQHALAILGHDGTHFTLSHDRRLNDFLTNLIAFWPIGLTVSGYRALHFKHHKHTGTEDDPELGHKRSRSPQWDLPAKPSRILKYAALDIVGGSFPDYLIILKYSKPDKPSEYLPLLCFHAVAVTLLAVSGLWWAGLLWYAGLVTTFMMSFRLRLWLEHQGTPETHRLYLNFWQAAASCPAQFMACTGSITHGRRFRITGLRSEKTCRLKNPSGHWESFCSGSNRRIIFPRDRSVAATGTHDHQAEPPTLPAILWS